MAVEKQTPLHPNHVSMGAKMVPFAGFSMPVQYSGIRQEHEAVRGAVGLFDVSHMGNFFVTGRDARAFLQWATVNNVDKLKPFDVQYSALCYPNGTVVDDILVYCLDAERFKLVVNASNIDKDLAWLESLKPQAAAAGAVDVTLRNASDELGILSLQGPRALAVAAKVMDSNPETVATYKAGMGRVNGVETLYSRTGYTGEDGFEFFPEHRDAVALWSRLLEAGSGEGLLPIGLGARDTLRLEAGYSLYGHELSDQINLIEAGLSWITDFNKGGFMGRQALEACKAAPARKMVGVELQELAIPREGCRVRGGGVEIGSVTSGTMSPTLNKGIAMALVRTDWAKIGTEVEVVVRDAGKKARVVSRHFYKRAK